MSLLHRYLKMRIDEFSVQYYIIRNLVNRLPRCRFLFVLYVRPYGYLGATFNIVSVRLLLCWKDLPLLASLVYSDLIT
jgi:hypothetical protein